MTDWINILMLVCATVGSMAFGVLAAYGVFRVGFALMRRRAVAPAAIKPQPEAAL
jgi:ABC-type glycerol-3-phosphate transport system permease component